MSPRRPQYTETRVMVQVRMSPALRDAILRAAAGYDPPADMTRVVIDALRAFGPVREELET